MSTSENRVLPRDGRMSAKNALKNQIVAEKRKTQALEIIRDNIDWDRLSPKDEETLWSYFIKHG